MKKSAGIYVSTLITIVLASVTSMAAIETASRLSDIHLRLDVNFLPALAVSSISFFLSQLLFPKCRFRMRPLISPLNWFLCMFFLQLVIMPTTISLMGPSAQFLSFMPSDFAINSALLLITLAFWSFCVAVQIVHKKNAGGIPQRYRRQAVKWLPPRWLIILFAILGTAGIAFRFGSVRDLTNYFLNPQSYMTRSQAAAATPTSLAGAASTFLLSFASFSVILLWCRGTYRRHRSIGIISRIRGPLLVILIALLTPLYGYNRATFLIPMIALMAVMTKRQPSSGLLKAFVLSILAVFVLLTISSYRIDANRRSSTGKNGIDLSMMFQDYGAAPQYLGFLLQGSDYGKDLGMGRILLSSALSPIPVLGKSFRDSSGTSIYGVLLGRTDQPARFVGELFLDFNVLGVIFGFLALGYITSILQNRFETATEALEIYILQFAALWLSYFVISSLEVVSQSAIYFSWPIYGFLLYKAAVTRLRQVGRGAEIPAILYAKGSVGVYRSS